MNKIYTEKDFENLGEDIGDKYVEEGITSIQEILVTIERTGKIIISGENYLETFKIRPANEGSIEWSEHLMCLALELGWNNIFNTKFVIQLNLPEIRNVVGNMYIAEVKISPNYIRMLEISNRGGDLSKYNPETLNPMLEASRILSHIESNYLYGLKIKEYPLIPEKKPQVIEESMEFMPAPDHDDTPFRVVVIDSVTQKPLQSSKLITIVDYGEMWDLISLVGEECLFPNSTEQSRPILLIQNYDTHGSPFYTFCIE